VPCEKNHVLELWLPPDLDKACLEKGVLLQILLIWFHLLLDKNF